MSPTAEDRMTSVVKGCIALALGLIVGAMLLAGFALLLKPTKRVPFEERGSASAGYSPCMVVPPDTDAYQPVPAAAVERLKF